VLLLLVVFAVDLPVVPGAVVVGAFALLHGHAHGSEVAETGGLAHMAGFCARDLHLARAWNRVCSLGAAGSFVRLAGTACVAVGAVIRAKRAARRA
jgi:urease accessory protein